MHIQNLFFIILIFLTYSFTSGFGQEVSNSFENEIGSFYADQTQYEISRTFETIVKIHGQINDVSRTSKVVIIFTLPDGSKTGNSVFTTDAGEFETLFPLNHDSQEGQYSVFVSHNAKVIGQIEFNVTEKPPENPFVSKPIEKEQNKTTIESPSPPQEKPSEEEQTMEIPKDEGSYELEDGNLIYYSINNGDLIDMNINKDIAVLSSNINFFGEGTITLGIPRHVLDAKENDNDVDFIVRINGNPVDYQYVRSNQYDRVIMINSVGGLSQIEIIGTQLKEPIQTEKQTLRVYISDVPVWTTNMDDTILESFNYWEEQYPNLEFEQVGENELQDFFILWVKDFGVEHVGYAFDNKFIEVGLGDSQCREKWLPYSSNHVGYILKHEIGHIIGLGHDSDPNSIMYPVAQNHEYGLETEEWVSTSGYVKYFPLCTIRDSTSYDISITTDDPTYGFNAYVVSSEKQFQNAIDDNTIEHFKDSGCYKENTLNFEGSCKVSKGSGILITMNDKQTQNLTNMKMQLQEKSNILEKSQSTKQKITNSSICGTGTIEKDGMCVPARTITPQVGVKEGQWVKYKFNLNTDSTNEFIGLLIKTAMLQAFENTDLNVNDIEWIKSEIMTVSNEQITTQNSILIKNEQTESTYEKTEDLNSLSSTSWIIPTNYQVGDVLYSDKTYGDAKVVGIKTKTYGKKTFETIEVRAEKSINEEGNIALYTITQNYDQKTGVMLETLLEIKVANVIFGAVSMNLHMKAIDSYITTPENKGGGCLIATATYGSELAPQVQQLRELRDNSLLQTASGTSFMTGFNQFYYSFSPTIADWERENPVFKEAVKITITPMISSLSILNHVDMDSEKSVLGYGISLILLNMGMYFVAPAIVIHAIRKKI